MFDIFFGQFLSRGKNFFLKIFSDFDFFSVRKSADFGPNRPILAYLALSQSQGGGY